MISILGDEEKRAVYDQTGCVDDTVSEFLVIFIRINESRITGHSLGPKTCCIYFLAFDFEGRNSLPLLASHSEQ